MKPCRVISCVTSDLVTDQRVHRICNTMAENNYLVLLVGREKKNSQKLNQRSYPTHRLAPFFEKGPLFYLEFNLRLVYFLLFKKADLLIANDLDTMPACFLIKMIRRSKLIYDSHEFFTGLPELVNRPFKRSIWNFLERLTIHSMDLGLTVSGGIAEAFMTNYHIDMKVILNLPESYNIANYLGSVKHKIDDGDKYCILFYQGSVNVARGLEEMIEAMAFLPLCRLFIAGGGDVLEDLKSSVENLDWKERIVFLGRIPFGELRYYTVQANLGISIEKKSGLSYTHALPNKFFDYVQAGVPVLISSLPEMVKMNRQYGVAEIIADHNPATISNSILHLLADKEKLAIMKKEISQARNEWTWEKEESKLLALVSHLSGPTE